MKSAGGTLDDALYRRIQDELLDDLDEELEMEVEDLAPGVEGAKERADSEEFRKFYFRELLRLQRELVKLQDWIVASGHKLVVLFEGRARWCSSTAAGTTAPAWSA